ncbi:hypothetical protein M2440_002730 [Methylorubrum extorquens]|nr:hypothetical protein [Methylorubrum extorquens]
MEDTENEKKKPAKSGLSEQDILNRAATGLSKSLSYTSNDIEQKRVAGLKLYKRSPFAGDDQLNGRSGYVTSDTFDNVEWLTSNLMKLFDGQDRVVQFSPNGPEDEPLAEQMTDVCELHRHGSEQPRAVDA